MIPPVQLAGRVALVTGGGTGLGRALCGRLAAEGAAVAVNYARSHEEAEAVAAEIVTTGGQAIAVRADVSVADDIDAMVQKIEQDLGPLDVLVANAGTTSYVPYDELEGVTPELWQRILGVNLIGTFSCVQRIAPGMLERGFGRIVAISSNSALGGTGSSIPYVVSKGALNTLVLCLARALAPTVQVNAVAPGWMRTPWIDKHLPEEVAAALLDPAANPADVDDVAAVAIGLAANGSVTGQVVVVDRGELVLAGGSR
jgi:3-oxoacyl-[acyl-carrier protein] reductase